MVRAVVVDGQAAVMHLDPLTGHATVGWGGWLRPGGPMGHTRMAAGVPLATTAFTTQGGKLQPVPPPPRPPGRLQRLGRRVRHRPRRSVAALLVVGLSGAAAARWGEHGAAWARDALLQGWTPDRH